jgi:hypothetical protein
VKALRTFFGQSVPPDAQALTGDEMSVAETRPYVEATAKSRHSPGTPLSS